MKRPIMVAFLVLAAFSFLLLMLLAFASLFTTVVATSQSLPELAAMSQVIILGLQRTFAQSLRHLDIVDGMMQVDCGDAMDLDFVEFENFLSAQRHDRPKHSLSWAPLVHNDDMSTFVNRIRQEEVRRCRYQCSMNFLRFNKRTNQRA